MRWTQALEHFQAHPLGAVHLAVAMLAIACGTAVIFMLKGTRRHVWVGRAYLVLMLALNATALAIYELFGRFGLFHWMALASLASLVAGVVPAWRRKPGWRTVHASWMSGSYVGLLAALVAEVGTRYLPVPFFWGVGLCSVAVIGTGVFLIRRHVSRL